MDTVTDNMSYATNRNKMMKEYTGESKKDKDSQDERKLFHDDDNAQDGSQFFSGKDDEDCYSTVLDLEIPNREGSSEHKKSPVAAVTEYWSISSDEISMFRQAKTDKTQDATSYDQIADQMSVYDDITSYAEYTEIPCQYDSKHRLASARKYRSLEMEKLEGEVYTNQFDAQAYYNRASCAVLTEEYLAAEVTRLDKPEYYESRKTNLKDDLQNLACSSDEITEAVYNNF